MPPVPEFSSLIVSRPSSRAHLLRRVRGLALATALYAAGVACLLVAPLLMIEMVQSPKADISSIIFRPPHRKGDNLPAGTIRQGQANGSEHPAQAKSRHPEPAHRPPHPVVGSIPPPVSEVPQTTPESSGAEDGGEGPPKGNPLGTGTRSEGPLLGCTDCPGTGPGTPDGPEDIYYPDTSGLTPPRLVPSTRALPKYPDLPRRAGLQGTVILLIVVEKDGGVGEIEVVRSPDQRWGFDLAAIDAVKQWRYRPALLGDRPVAAYITVMIEFSLSR